MSVPPVEPRILAGCFDPRRRLRGSRVEGALAHLVRADGHSATSSDGVLVAGCAGPRKWEVVHGTVLCVLEGWIANASRLGHELRLLPDASQSEVLATAYSAWGTGVLDRLRGSFVFAIWDVAQRAGLLGVDQVGGRALHYATLADGSLAFASEVNALLPLLPVAPAANEAALVQWLVELRVPDEQTFFAGVQRLGAAHCIELDESGWRRRRYWFPAYRPPFTRLSRGDLSEALWEHVVGSIESKLAPGDVPAVILSGGIDSSFVAAAAVEVARRTAVQLPRSYSAVFPGDGRMDESKRIDALTDSLGIPNVQLRLQPSGALALMLEYLDMWKLPLPGAGATVEQPLVERAAAEGVTVLLDGQAGDELFGRASFLMADRLRHGRLLSSIQLARSVPPPIGAAGMSPWKKTYRIWRFCAARGAVPLRVHRALRRLRRRRPDPPAWFAASALQPDIAVGDWTWKRHSGPRWWARQVDVLTHMREAGGPNDYLRHRAASAGLEARPPLVDVDLIEFALRIPPELGFDGSVQDRPLAREALRGRVPDVIRLNPIKSNLAPFFYEMLAGSDLRTIRKLLEGPDAQIRDYVERRELVSLLDRPPGVGGPNWREWFMSIWRLATVECWLREQADPGFAARTLGDGSVTRTVRDDHRIRT